MRGLICTNALLCLTASAAFAQVDEPKFASQQPSGLQVMYALSYKLDVCGDADFGNAVRKAAMDVLDYCHVPADQQAGFRKEAADIDTGSKKKIIQYLQDHGTYPDKLDGDKMTCKEKQAAPKYMTDKDLFTHYAKGDITLDKVLPDTCKLLEPFPM